LAEAPLQGELKQGRADRRPKLTMAEKLRGFSTTFVAKQRLCQKRPLGLGRFDCGASV